MNHDPRHVERFIQSLPAVCDPSQFSHLHLVHWPLDQLPLGPVLSEVGFTGTLVAARSSTAEMAENMGGFDQVVVHEHPTAGESATDHILMELPQGREAARLAIQEALKALPSEGALWVFGNKESGIMPLPKRLPGSQSVLSKGHLRLLRIPATAQWEEPKKRGKAKRAPFDFSTPFHHYQQGELTLATRPGIFSWQEADLASLILLETLAEQPPLTGELLDWGCGAGLIGVTLAKQNAGLQVTMSDDMVRAVRCSEESANLNGVAERCEVILEDGIGEQLSEMTFDHIVTNPPFHRGHSMDREVAQQFIRDAAAQLVLGGKLWLVANDFLDYGTVLGECFGKVEKWVKRDNFTVWCAEAV
uniref:Putative Ribosomal RNA small subunit methyltransferase C, putative genen rsmC n=1 Tax=Magnetococcus massalia (strain MO-1) TaxID=451514 RepID=A0A1S7LNI4_MAGMO|nr:putative Ribosomal RNA small subunit methyltransferase C, putative genen rsmC [Candidatus Magnetococcus massalia]